MENNGNNTDHTLKVIFEQMPWMAALTKLENDVLLKTNNSFEEMTGYTNQELIGKSLKSTKIIVKPFDPNIFKQKATEENGVTKFNVILKNKNEKMFKGMLSICQILYKDEPSILYIINEINMPKNPQ